MRQKPVNEFEPEDLVIEEEYSDCGITLEERINQYIMWCEKECYESVEGCDICKTFKG